MITEQHILFWLGCAGCGVVADSLPRAVAYALIWGCTIALLQK